MLFTPEVYWMQSTRRLKFLGLRSPPKWRVSLQKFWTQWTQLVILELSTFLFYPLTWSFSNIGVLFLSIAVVKQEGLQGDTSEVGWIVQEQFWNLHQPEDWQGQQQPDRRDSRSWSNLLRQCCANVLCVRMVEKMSP